MTDNSEKQKRKKTTKKVTFVGILVNIVLAAAQIISGALAHSQALVADGLHTLSDLVSDFVVLISTHHAAKEADEDHPYGHGRIETLSSIFLGVALISVAFGMGYRGIQSMINPSEIIIEPYAIFFALLAIICKESLYRYTIKAAREIKSTLLESNALHHRSDAFSSIVVLIGVSAQIAGIPHMDAIAAVIVAIMISMMGIHITKKAFSELIDTSLNPELVQKIREHILNIDAVFDIHSLRSRSMGGQGIVDTEIRVNPHITVSEAHYIALHIEQSVQRSFSEISDITVHIDPIAEIDHNQLLTLPSRSELLFALYSAWETLEESNSIKNVHLHYLSDRVDLDIILPLNITKSTDLSLQNALFNRVKQIPHIGEVNIYYQVET